MKLEILSSSPTSQPIGTIILIHGAWHSALCWADTFLPYFAEQGYNVLAPSLRNHGKSEANGSLRWRRIREYAADIQQVVNSTEGKVYLVGHSLGGHVIQKYLELYPNSRVEKAVLLCSVPPHGVWRSTLKAIRTQPFSFLLVNLTFSLMPIINTKEKVKELFFTNRISDKALDKAFTNVQDESFLTYLDMLFLDLPRPKKIKTPMLVIGGSEDFVFGKKDVLATAKPTILRGSFLKAKPTIFLWKTIGKKQRTLFLHFYLLRPLIELIGLIYRFFFVTTTNDDYEF